MLCDIATQFTFDHLYGKALIDFNSDNGWASLANGCYAPARWALGRMVVAVHPQNTLAEKRYTSHTESGFFKANWILTCLKIILYIPTLLGRLFQTIAKCNDTIFAERINLAYEASVYHGLLYSEESPNKDPEYTDGCIDFMLPEYDQKSLLAKQVLVDCINDPTDKRLNEMSAWLLGYTTAHNSPYWMDIAKAAGCVEDNEKYLNRLEEMLVGLARDDMHGAANVLKLHKKIQSVSPLMNLLAPKGIPEDKTSIDKFSLELLKKQLASLSDGQKEKITTIASSRWLDSFKNNPPDERRFSDLNAQILLQLDFKGVDKKQACNRLLKGYDMTTEWSHGPETEKVKPLLSKELREQLETIARG